MTQTQESWNILRLLNWCEDYFKQQGIMSPRLDAELLIAHHLNLTRIQVYTHFDQPLSESELSEFKKLLKRRAGHEPLAYILGEKEFFSLKFRVHSGVLIPRPETEELVEHVLEQVDQNFSGKILDIGTGSGCILVTLLKKLPLTQGTAIEISQEAIACAQENAAFHGVLDRCEWIQNDFCLLELEDFSGPFDIITANLPYIPEDEIQDLMPEVRDFEPSQALLASEKGLHLIKIALSKLPEWLSPGGRAYFEIGYDQGEDCLRLVADQDYISAQIHKDLSGKDRILEISSLGNE